MEAVSSALAAGPELVDKLRDCDWLSVERRGRGFLDGGFAVPGKSAQFFDK